MVYRGIDLALVTKPLERPRMKFNDVDAMPSTQLGVKQLGEQVVISEPCVVPVESDDEYVCSS